MGGWVVFTFLGGKEVLDAVLVAVVGSRDYGHVACLGGRGWVGGWDWINWNGWMDLYGWVWVMGG